MLYLAQGIATPPDARPAPVQSLEAIRPACGNYRHGNAPPSGMRSVPTLSREHWRAYKRTAPRWSAYDTNQLRKAALRRALRPAPKPNRVSPHRHRGYRRPLPAPGAKAAWVLVGPRNPPTNT